MKKHVEQPEIELAFFDTEKRYQHVTFFGELEGIPAKVDEIEGQGATDLTVFVDDDVYYEFGQYTTEEQYVEEGLGVKGEWSVRQTGLA